MLDKINLRQVPWTVLLAAAMVVGLVAIVLSVANPSVRADGTVVATDSYEGREITKGIAILRKAGGDPNVPASPAWMANNIESFLKEGKIKVKSFGEPSVMGKNYERGGPVFLDPANFLPESMNSGNGWKQDSRIGFRQLVAMISTIVHEKHHSENHHIGHRAGGALRELTDGR